MNLADIREAIRVKTGYPERGKAGTDRLNNTINQSLRNLWGEIPEVLLKDEHRLQLDPEQTCTVKRDALDPKVLLITGTSPFSVIDSDIKTINGRWVEWNHDGKWYQRRIAELFTGTVDNELAFFLSVTEPIPTSIASVSTAMNAKVYTYEYPYDADIQSIRRIVKNPETNPREIPLSAMGGELSGVKISNGWQSTGQVQYYARGDFYQQPAPHYTPEVSFPDHSSENWGFTLGAGSTENTNYGRAGTFSYVVCHVWGRYSPEMRQIDGATSYDTSPASSEMYKGPDVGFPFYISAPSKESGKIATTWGGPPIEIKTPDIDYVYGFGQDNTLKSYRKSGIEKWIFRARHSTSVSTVGDSVQSEMMEDDGIYYLWQIVDGEEQVAVDVGQFDPVARKFPLKEFMGHYHIRFDKRPSAKDQILVSAIRRPPLLKYDSDSPNLPPECYGCIIELACSFLVGDRDGDIKRKSIYYDAHLVELQKLKRMYSFAGHERPAFGNGLSTVSYFRTGDYPVTETS